MGSERAGCLTLEQFAEEFANNHAEFESFAWSGGYEIDKEGGDCRQWGIYYTSNRDSDILYKSNEKVIEEEMGEFDEGQVRFERHSHWLVGYVDGLSVRVYNDDGTITDACRKLHDILCRMDDYPVLDEEDYSQREFDASLEYIEMLCPPRGVEMIDELPEDWVHQVWEWLWDNDYPFEHDSGGMYLYTRRENEDDVLAEALIDLGLAVKEE